MNTRIRRSLAVLFFLMAGAPPCWAEHLVREIRWSELKEQGQLSAGEIMTATDSSADQTLQVIHGAEGPATQELFAVSSPGISQLQYAITGRIRYTGVADGSCLEMWNHFPDGSFYFTRTLAEAGPMQKLAGDSPWRDFSLPFFSSPEAGVPARLVVNLVFTGPGTVELSPVRLIEYESAGALQNAFNRDGWWGWQVGVILGAGGGTLLGLIGAAIGVLCGFGLARRFVLAMMTTVFVAGCVSLVAGLLALVQLQPYHVFYPLLLLGIISVAVIGPLLFAVRRRYEQQELRRVAAPDASR